jgi:hypothetical protein
VPFEPLLMEQPDELYRSVLREDVGFPAKTLEE